VGVFGFPKRKRIWVLSLDVPVRNLMPGYRFESLHLLGSIDHSFPRSASGDRRRWALRRQHTPAELWRTGPARGTNFELRLNCYTCRHKCQPGASFAERSLTSFLWLCLTSQMGNAISPRGVMPKISRPLVARTQHARFSVRQSLLPRSSLCRFSCAYAWHMRKQWP
jgi:hypothetical protein